jgi:hypothetical protein
MPKNFRKIRKRAPPQPKLWKFATKKSANPFRKKMPAKMELIVAENAVSVRV